MFSHWCDILPFTLIFVYIKTKTKHKERNQPKQLRKVQGLRNSCGKKCMHFQYQGFIPLIKFSHVLISIDICLRDPLVTQTVKVKGRRDYIPFCMALDSWMDNSSYFFQHRTLWGVESSNVIFKHILKRYLKISLYITSLTKIFHYTFYVPNRIYMIWCTAECMNMLYSTLTY